MRKPTGVKIWMRSRLFGASATTKVPFGATANAVGSMMRPASPPMWTISHELACCCVEAVDDVRAAIEDEVLSGGGLLKAGRLAETCRRCAAGRRRSTAATSGLSAASDDGQEPAAGDSAESAHDRASGPVRAWRASAVSVPRGFADGLQHVRRTAAGSLLRGPGCRRPGVFERADAPDRRVEVLEQLAGDPGGDLGAEAAHHLIFVRDRRRGSCA